MISDHSDDEEPTTNTEPTTRVSGFFIDPVTQFTGGYKKSDPITLSQTVRLLADRVLKKVNTEYTFVPKLKRSDMIFDPLCDAENSDDLHGIKDLDEEDGLVVLITPKKPAAKRVKRRFATIKETEKKASELIKAIRKEDSDDKGGGIDDLVDLFRGLRSDMGELNRSLRREQEERKADSASHKEESARLKEESARLEALRKKDRVDAEKRAEEQMKRLEALRKKDRVDAEKRAEEQMERLEALRKNDIEDLEIKIEHLKQLNIEREDQWKQKYESTQRYIECLASDIDATTDFLAVGDEAGLDRIKRRNLLDRAQASLALSLGLSDKSYSASIQFRETLNRASSLEERQQRLLEILTEKKDELPSQAALLITKPEALNLLAEQYPRVRLDGDQVAHGHRERSWYEGAVFRSVGKDKIALTSLLDYVSPAAR